MKFTLHRKPDSKAQKIPYAALQIAGLADAEALVLRAKMAAFFWHVTRSLPGKLSR